jgi:hypothetical protein
MFHPTINFHGRIISLSAPQLTLNTKFNKTTLLTLIGFYEAYGTDELHTHKHIYIYTQGGLMWKTKPDSAAKLCSDSTKKQPSVLGGTPQRSTDSM